MSNMCVLKTQQRGPVLKINFTVLKRSDAHITFSSKVLTVDDLAVFEAKLNKASPNSNLIGLSVRMKKSDNTKNLIISVNITSGGINKQFFCPEDWVEVMIAQNLDIDKSYNCGCATAKTYYIFNIEVNIIVHAMIPAASTLSIDLYKDTKSMDFNLQAADGAVPVHKSILFVHSEMFRTMLKGNWKETDEDSINMPGETVQTLQHLKDYMYLGTIPEDGLEALLVLAKRCLMDKLAAGCIEKLVSSVKAETFDGLVELACQNNIPELMRALVLRIPDAVINGISKMKIEEQKLADKK